MNYQLVNLHEWERKEHYDHYLKTVPCTYSVTTEVEISAVLAHLRMGEPFYPKMIHLITSVVNQLPEFRMSLVEGQLIIWDQVEPTYTIFHKESETFSSIWTTYDPDYPQFLRNYQKDQEAYGNQLGLFTKPNSPANHISISSLPWTNFTGFDLNIGGKLDYLSPIFTMGKFRKEGDETWLPLAIQVHHAVIDGFHLSRFIDQLQDVCRMTASESGN